MVEHDGCIGCKYECQDEHLEPCLHCGGTKSGDYYNHMTNGDKIRSMSDEELADWLENVTDDVIKGSCWNKYGWIGWLQSEEE